MYKLLGGKSAKSKFFYLSGLLLILLIVFVTCLYYSVHKLTVNFFDIGQGDSALIILPNKQTILIDGGPDNTVLRRLGDSLPFYQRQIDLIIFSHYHRDHITGLIEVLNRYKVKEIIYAPSHFDSSLLRTLWRTIKEQKVTTVPIPRTAQLYLSPNCFLYFLNPQILWVKNDQNNSLIVRLSCQGKIFLFSGDNNALVEKKLVNYAWDIKADVLKISHHGSKTASSKLFLQKVNPDLAIISLGLDNRFGHPNQVVLDRLNELGIPFRRTDQSGSVKIVILGENSYKK